jgi:hypothetical protein
MVKPIYSLMPRAHCWRKDFHRSAVELLSSCFGCLYVIRKCLSTSRKNGSASGSRAMVR